MTFPPMVLTHITKDNALFYGACQLGINEFLAKYNLLNLTAIPVSRLLNHSKKSGYRTHWIKCIAGLSNGEAKDGYINRYGQGTLKGDGYDLDLEDTNESQDGYLLFFNPGNEADHIYAYGYGYGDGNGYGSGHGNEKGYGYGHGNGDGYVSGDGYGNGYKDGSGHGYVN